MEDKKREGSLPRTLASPKFSLKKLVNGLSRFCSEFLYKHRYGYRISPKRGT